MSSRLRTRLRAGTGLATASLSLEFATASGTLDPRITFSRGSQATITDATGKLTYAPNNLLANSEDFENSFWAKTNCTVTANATAAPNGSTTADAIVEDATASAVHRLSSSGVNVTSGVTYILSVYAKKSAVDFLFLNYGTAFFGTVSAVFNINTGVVVSQSGGVASIQSVGNGWYRCAFAVTAIATGASQIFYQPSDNSSSAAYTGVNGRTSAFLWGAQLEQVTYQTTPGTYNSTSPKNLLGYTQEFDNAAWTKSNSFVQTNLATYSEAFDNAIWTKDLSSVTANATTAPDGTSNADLWVATTSGNTSTVRIVRSISVTSGAVYTASVYVKAFGRRWVYFTAPDASSSAYNCWFDLQNGVVGTKGASVTTATITAVGSGWYRLTTTSTATTALNYMFISSPDADNSATVTANGVNGLYLWGAQLVQGSTAGDYQRTDAAAAAVQYTAPDGSRTADKLVPASSGAARSLYATFLASGSSNTASIYLKAGEKSIAGFVDYPGSLGAAWFNLLTGEVTNVLAGYTASMQSVGGGWYRCSITATPASGTRYVQIFVSDTAGSLNVTGDGTSGIYIWGAQLSNSASLDAYSYNPVAAPTSAAYYGPRFDYTPVTRASRGLLIEEARTNLLTYSDQFDNAAWTKSNATVAANATLAPDGTLSADKLQVANTTNIQKNVSQSAGAISTTYTDTVYAKAAELGWLIINQYDGADRRTWFNLTSGTVGTVAAGATASITSIGNGWYRCSVTRTTGTGSIGFVLNVANADNVADFAGTVGDGIFIWGSQREAGSFATTYIPTVASTVTRSADVALMQGANFSNWYNQNEGTLFADASFIGRPAGVGNCRVAVISDGTSSNFISAAFRNNAASPGVFYGQVLSGGATQALLPSSIASDIGDNTSLKSVIGYQTNNFVASANGSTPETDTSGIVPTVNTLYIGSFNSGMNFTNGHISRIGYYPTRLRNDQLQVLTS